MQKKKELLDELERVERDASSPLGALREATLALGTLDMEAEEAARRWQKARQALRDARHDLENVQKLRSKTKELNVSSSAPRNLTLTLTRTLTPHPTRHPNPHPNPHPHPHRIFNPHLGACMEEAPRRAASRRPQVFRRARRRPEQWPSPL